MQLQKVYTDDQIIDLLNTVSKNNKVPLNPQIMDNNNEWEIIG
jgi:DNA-binding MltR family transcriptional regulator